MMIYNNENNYPRIVNQYEGPENRLTDRDNQKIDIILYDKRKNEIRVY